jgi:hypothetical protein
MQGGGCTSSCEAGGHDAPSHDGMSGAMQHHEFASGSHSERPHFGSGAHSERPHFASKWPDRGGSRGFGTVRHDEIRPPRARMHHNTEHHLFRPMQTHYHWTAQQRPHVNPPRKTHVHTAHSRYIPARGKLHWERSGHHEWHIIDVGFTPPPRVVKPVIHRAYHPTQKVVRVAAHDRACPSVPGTVCYTVTTTRVEVICRNVRHT